MKAIKTPIVWVGWSQPSEKATVESCFGICCPIRSSCQYYFAVELLAGGSTTRASCFRDGSHPQYAPMIAESQMKDMMHVDGLSDGVGAARLR
jgi:hypothetical protein